MIVETKKINIQKTVESRITSIDFNNLRFGREFSDHMLVMDYADGEWQTPTIKPFENLSISPAMSALHYGQSIFEGMKAYKSDAGEVLLFRPEENMKRMNRSAVRMCMPEIPIDLFKEGLTELMRLDSAWVPPSEDASLYIRPFMFATDEYIGVKPSDTYRFMIFTCPVHGYYTEPLRVKIETEYTRAADGGVGYAKAAGNYAASLYPAKLGQEQGYHQLVWTDGVEHKYIEESGTMNIMFVIGDKLITPSTSQTILSGITRDSVITLAKDWGMTVEERRISVDEIIMAAGDGSLKEAFGAGTAATIAQIAVIGHNGTDFELPEVKTREFSNKVYDHLSELKRGNAEDKFNWVYRLSPDE
jgi:branched-chain amino acid aminotransferase